MTTPPEPPQGDAWQNAPRMSPEQDQPQYGAPPPPGGPPGYGGGGYGGQPGYGGGGYPQKSPSNGMGIAALVLGILGLLTSFFFIGGVLGLLAVIFGVMGRKKVKRGEATNGGMALTGIILGAIAMLITIVVVVFAVLLADEIGGLAECLEQAQGDPTAEQQCQRNFEDQFQ